MNDKIIVLTPCEIPNLEKYVDIALIESELNTRLVIERNGRMVLLRTALKWITEILK